jgi:hypothetical protein
MQGQKSRGRRNVLPKRRCLPTRAHDDMAHNITQSTLPAVETPPPQKSYNLRHSISVICAPIHDMSQLPHVQASLPFAQHLTLTGTHHPIKLSVNFVCKIFY